MRILMVNKYAHVTGGADRQCLSLAESLRANGHEVAFLAMQSPRNLESAGCFVPTVVTHDTRDVLTSRERLGVLRDAVWNRHAAAAMRCIVRTFRPDVAHVHRLYPQLSVSPVVVARREGVPVVQTLHDYEFISANPFDATGSWLDRRESRLAYRLLNTMTFAARRRFHVPAVSEWIAVSEFVARVHEVRRIRATVVPNFADVDPGRSPLELEQREGLVFVGALSREKGVLDVLEVARRLSDTRVVLAGRGPLSDRIAREARTLPNVDLRGLLDRAAVEEALGSARAAVLPSRWEEPFSLVAVEAMAVGTPIVTYRSGGLGEHVARLRAGITADPSSRALVSACARLLQDDDLWSKCSLAGLRAAHTEFSRETHVESVLTVYERALAR